MSRQETHSRKLKSDSASLAASAARQRRQQASQLSIAHRDAARWEKRMQSGGGEGQDAQQTQVNTAQVLAALNLLKDNLGSWQEQHAGDRLLLAVRALRQCAGAQGWNDAGLQNETIVLLSRAVELTYSAAPEIAEEAVWGLNNLMVASSEAADGVMDVLPRLVLSVNSSSLGLCGQCAVAFGNLSMEGHDYRERLLAAGAAEAVGRLIVELATKVVVDDEQPSTSRPSPPPADSPLVSRAMCNSLWSLSQLIRGTGSCMEAIAQDSVLLDCLLSLLSTSGGQWLEEVGWVLVYLSAGPASVCGALIERRAGEAVLEQISRMVGGGESEEGRWAQQMVPLLRCAGNLICEMNPLEAKLQHTERILSLIPSLVQAKHRGVRKEAARLCSFLPYLNSCAHNHPVSPAALQVQQQLLALLLSMLLKAVFDLRKEAAYALLNWCLYDEASRRESGEGHVGKLLIEELLQQSEVLSTFLQLLRHSDVEANRLGLEFTELVLSRVPRGPYLVESADGIDALEQVQYHCSRQELANLAGQLVDKYYGEDYGLEDSGAPEPPAWAAMSGLGGLNH